MAKRQAEGPGDWGRPKFLKMELWMIWFLTSIYWCLKYLGNTYLIFLIFVKSILHFFSDSSEKINTNPKLIAVCQSQELCEKFRRRWSLLEFYVWLVQQLQKLQNIEHMDFSLMGTPNLWSWFGGLWGLGSC